MYYVGIDIAKSFHVVSVIDDEETKVINKPFKINNNAKGFDKSLTMLVLKGCLVKILSHLIGGVNF